MNTRARVAGAIAALVLAWGCVSARQPVGATSESWVGVWEGPPQLTESRNLPPDPGLTGTTLRQVLRLSLGGSKLRIRLSNEFGNAPLAIGAVHVALSRGADAIDSTTDVLVRFRGSLSATVAPGEAIISDEIAFASLAGTRIAVSMYIVSAPPNVTGHPGSRTTSYLGRGDQSGANVIVNSVPVEHWYFVTEVHATPSAPSAAVVVLGNSIADGRGSTTNMNDRWPDNLGRRLQSDRTTTRVSVLNAGIGGNAILRGGLGPTALARLDRDVFGQPGVRWLLVSEGVNDIGGARGADTSALVARQLIEAYGRVIARAHDRGLLVYGATILPFGGSSYSGPDHEAARERVNSWIRTSHAFDAIVDFDAAMRDSLQPTRLRPLLDGGDHLHPNARGYQVMADAVDVSLFVGRGSR